MIKRAGNKWSRYTALMDGCIAIAGVLVGAAVFVLLLLHVEWW